MTERIGGYLIDKSSETLVIKRRKGSQSYSILWMVMLLVIIVVALISLVFPPILYARHRGFREMTVQFDRQSDKVVIKQAIFAAGFASTFARLRHRQKQDRQQRVEALKAKRTGKAEAEEVLPPPAA